MSAKPYNRRRVSVAQRNVLTRMRNGSRLYSNEFGWWLAHPDNTTTRVHANVTEGLRTRGLIHGKAAGAVQFWNMKEGLAAVLRLLKDA